MNPLDIKAITESKVVPPGADGNIHCICRADFLVDGIQFSLCLNKILA